MAERTFSDRELALITSEKQRVLGRAVDPVQITDGRGSYAVTARKAFTQVLVLCDRSALNADTQAKVTLYVDSVPMAPTPFRGHSALQGLLPLIGVTLSEQARGVEVRVEFERIPVSSIPVRIELA